MNDDAVVKGVAWFVGILIAVTVGVFVGGPIFAILTLVKGWDNTSGLIKLAAFVLPLVFLAFIFSDQGPVSGPSEDNLLLLWGIANPIITYAILFFAYAKRDQMFNV